MLEQALQAKRQALSDSEHQCSRLQQNIKQIQRILAVHQTSASNSPSDHHRLSSALTAEQGLIRCAAINAGSCSMSRINLRLVSTAGPQKSLLRLWIYVSGQAGTFRINPCGPELGAALLQGLGHILACCPSCD